MIHRKRGSRFVATPLLLASLPILVGALLTGCGRKRDEAAGEAGSPEVRHVLVVRSSIAMDEIVLAGRVEAREEVTLTSRVSGRLTALPVPDGAVFREGTTLARFDAPETREAVAAAEASWRAAKTSLDLARRQEARFESLYAAKVAALHELELVRAERERAEATEQGAAAAVAERRAGVEVRAPFAGVVVRHRVDPGAEVGLGTPLLDIRSRAGGLVVAAVPEQSAAALAGPAFIQVGDGPWREATLVRADGMIDPVSRTRTARYRPTDGQALEPGAFARVRIGASEAAAGAPTNASATEWMLPSRSIVRRGALSGAFVLQDGRVSLRWLRLGRRDGASVAVLAGLDPGDSVVLDPAGLVDGRRVDAAR